MARAAARQRGEAGLLYYIILYYIILYYIILYRCARHYNSRHRVQQLVTFSSRHSLLPPLSNVLVIGRCAAPSLQ